MIEKNKVYLITFIILILLAGLFVGIYYATKTDNNEMVAGDVYLGDFELIDLQNRQISKSEGILAFYVKELIFNKENKDYAVAHVIECWDFPSNITKKSDIINNLLNYQDGTLGYEQILCNINYRTKKYTFLEPHPGNDVTVEVGYGNIYKNYLTYFYDKVDITNNFSRAHSAIIRKITD